VYQSSDFKVEEKADRSPLTHADRRSHEIIVTHLSQFDIPILSEEGRNISYEERKNWDTFWLGDPLYGTKEFFKKNGEFTVNTALSRDEKPEYVFLAASGLPALPGANFCTWMTWPMPAYF